MEEQIEAFLGCLVVFILIVFYGVTTFIPLNIVGRQNAEHVGYITAVEDEAGFPNFNGTYVYIKTDLSSSQEDTYCVQDSETVLIQSLKDAATSKSNVVIGYKALSFTGWQNCNGDIITSVQKVNK